MIRINLLPTAARRRRRPGREHAVLAVMSLGWVALLTAGYLWIAATEAEVVALRGQAAAVVSDRDAVRERFDERALVDREHALQNERAALAELATARQTPAVLFAALVEVAAASGSSSPFGGAGPVALQELRELADGQWQLVASAVDLPTLTDMLRRMRASHHFALVGRAEYARADDGRLTLRVTLTTP